MTALTRCAVRLAGDFARLAGQKNLAERLWADAAIEELEGKVRTNILHLSNPEVQIRHIRDMDYACASDTPPKRIDLSADVTGIFLRSSTLSTETQERLSAVIKPLTQLASNCGVAATGHVVETRESYTARVFDEGRIDLVDMDVYLAPRVEMTLRR